VLFLVRYVWTPAISWGFLFKVQGARYKVQGARYKAQGTRHKAQGTRYKAQGSMYKAQGTRLKVQGSRHKAQGTRCKAQGTRLRRLKFRMPEFYRRLRSSSLVPCFLFLVPYPVTSLCLAGWSHLWKLPDEATLHLGIILWIWSEAQKTSRPDPIEALRYE
jgi:hypothetical protein